jgi:hypothetical protein
MPSFSTIGGFEDADVGAREQTVRVGGVDDDRIDGNIGKISG